MAFLLSTQSFADFISRRPNAVRRWAKEQPEIAVAVSVISVGAVAAAIDAGVPPEHEKEFDPASWRRYLAEFEDKMHRQGRLLVVDRDVVRTWSSFRDRNLEDDGGELVGEDTKLIWATAIAHGLVLVDRPGSGTASLNALGLQVYDPTAIIRPGAWPPST